MGQTSGSTCIPPPHLAVAVRLHRALGDDSLHGSLKRLDGGIGRRRTRGFPLRRPHEVGARDKGRTLPRPFTCRAFVSVFFLLFFFLWVHFRTYSLASSGFDHGRWCTPGAYGGKGGGDERVKTDYLFKGSIATCVG